MGLRFRRSVTICKGVRVNFGSRGTSLSLGTRGCRYTMHTSGRRTVSAGIPGTGIYYTESVGGTSSNRRYNSAAHAQRQQIQQALQQQKQDELRQNKLLVDEYNNYIDLIREVHRECEEPIDWQNICSLSAPYLYGTKGPKQLEAEEKYNNFQPSFIQKLLKNNGEKTRNKLYEAISIAQKEDEEAYQNWKSMHDFAESIIRGDIESYLMAIEEANPFDDLLDYGSDFEIGTDSKNSITVEFRVKSCAVVPEVAMTLTSTGKLSKKKLSKTQYYDYTQDYVCSCAIRIAREIFAILPIEDVVVHAVDNILNTTTGNQEECTILSVVFKKERFKRVNFNNIDASDFVECFEHNMKFLKTAGFKPVKRIGE